MDLLILKTEIALPAYAGLDEPAVVHSEDMGQNFSFYVVYGQCRHRVDMGRIKVAKPEFETLDKEAINTLIAQKMQRKMMEFYKEHKINPASGCLPVLVQMPIFFGFYLWGLDIVFSRLLSLAFKRPF